MFYTRRLSYFLEHIRIDGGHQMILAMGGRVWCGSGGVMTA
jgi:hypothetical protein